MFLYINVCLCVCVFVELDWTLLFFFSFCTHRKYWEKKKQHTLNEENALSQLLLLCVYIVLLSNQNCFLFFCLAFTRLTTHTTFVSKNQWLMSRRRRCCYTSLFDVYTLIYVWVYMYMCARHRCTVCMYVFVCLFQFSFQLFTP